MKMKIILALVLLLVAIIIVKYNPVYEVSINGEIIGYVKSESNIKDRISKEVLVSDNPCAVFTTLKTEPTYKLKLAETNETNEDEIIQKLSQDKVTIYKVYAIVLNDEEKTYVDNIDEAEKIVNEMNEEYAESTKTSISVSEKYTENINELGITESTEARKCINDDLRIIKTEKEKIASATCNGVYLSVTPVVGNITSRYGAVESIRDHVHSGIDIAARAGTPIKAAADGKVSYSGWMSGYGNFVVIDHENGVQTCYGHCNKLYAKIGTEVKAGDVIATVGSTGNSTGNHLHFEIRINGSKINPQRYIYK